MSELAPEIAAVCDQYGIAKNVFVVDDEWDQRDSPDPVAWEEFTQALSVEENTYAQVTASLGSKGYDLACAPPSEVLTTVFAELGASVPAALLAAKNRFDDTPHVLKRLETILRNLNFDVKPFAAQPDLNTHGIPTLLIVDYHIEPEGKGGVVATGIFKEIMQLCEERNCPPPFVILMSQRLPIDGADAVSEVAAESGFLRFRYEFLHKLKLRGSPDAFHLTLLSLLRHNEASKAYFQQVRKLESESSRLGQVAARRLMQITPAEALLFRSRMHKEGTSLAQVFTDLFREILSHRLNRATPILEAMGALEEALAKHGFPAVEMSEGGPLHRIYAELVTQPVDSSHVSPPQFGDIYQDQAGRFLLVVSQECDLAFGSDRKVKAEKVLMLEAELTEQPTSDRAQICKPAYFEAERKHKWLCWSPVRVRLVDHSALAPPVPTGEHSPAPGEATSEFTKVFHLRTSDAEHVQQFFASHLTRVGVEPLPAPLQHFKGEIRNVEIGTSAEVILYAIADAEKILVAVSPTSIGVLLEHGGQIFLPASTVEKLTAFAPLAEVLSALKSDSVFLGNEDGRPIFVKPLSKRPRDMKEWKVPK